MISLFSRRQSVPTTNLNPLTSSPLNDLEWVDALRTQVASATRFVERYEQSRRKWGAPIPFSFDTEFNQMFDRQEKPDAEWTRLSKRFPHDAQSFEMIRDSLDSIVDRLVASTRCRRLMRSEATLKANLELLRRQLPGLSRLLGLFEIADEITLSVVVPAKGLTLHYHLEGVEDWNHLQILLRGMWQENEMLAGLMMDRIPNDVLEYSRGVSSTVETATLRSIWGWYSASAITNDRGFVEGFSATSHWLFGEQSPRRVVANDGMRTVCIGESPFETVIDVERKFPGLRSTVQLLVTEESTIPIERVSANRAVAQAA
jgi:hypothetical protein